MLQTFKKDWQKIFSRRHFHLNQNGSIDYDQYWRERRHNLSQAKLTDFQKKRADLIVSFLEPGETVLDLGCGDGNMLQYLKEKAGIKPIGVDISEEAKNSLVSKGIDMIKLDLNNSDRLDTIPEVDYITGFELIEHLPQPEQLVYKLSDKTKNGFIFSFPNTGYYAHRLRLLFGKFPLQWRTHPGEHLRFWTLSDTKCWVNDLGFEMKALLPYEGISILNKVLPGLFARGIVIVIESKK